MPLGLVQRGPRMYLVCRFEGYTNERNLALHRIFSASASSVTFRRPSGFDLKSYDDEGRFGFGIGELLKLGFWVDKDYGLHLLEFPLSEDQQVSEGRKHYRICATVFGFEIGASRLQTRKNVAPCRLWLSSLFPTLCLRRVHDHRCSFCRGFIGIQRTMLLCLTSCMSCRTAELGCSR